MKEAEWKSDFLSGAVNADELDVEMGNLYLNLEINPDTVSDDIETDTMLSTQSSESFTFDGVILMSIPSKMKDMYEKVWLPKMYGVVTQFKGFLRRTVHLMSVKGQKREYLIVMSFDSIEHFQIWQTSHERGALVQQLERMGSTVRLLNAYGEAADASISRNKRIHIQSSMHESTRPLPPPKWKLFVIIAISMWVAMTCNFIGGSAISMHAAKIYIPSGFIIFVSVVHIVLMLIYAAFPMIMSLSVVSGWLRAPRTPIHEMNCLHSLLDQGLQIFAFKHLADAGNIEMLKRVDKLEVRVDKLRSINHDLRESLASLSSKFSNSMRERGRATSLSGLNENGALMAKINQHKDMRNQISEDGRFPLNMSIGHYVKWEHVLDFERWCDDIEAEMKRF